MGGGKSGESWRDPEAAPPAPRVLVFRCWRHDVVVTAARWPSRWFSGSEGLCLPGLSAPPRPPALLTSWQQPLLAGQPAWVSETHVGFRLASFLLP